MKVRRKAPRASVDRATLVGSAAHYDDVAYYDATYAERTDDVAFYVDVALEHGGPVLEYGVGSGRVAVPLARAGIEVTGVDASKPMLDGLHERLAREPAEVRKRVKAVRGDMRDVAIRGRFPLILVTFNTFLHLYTRLDVERFLARAKAHLKVGGRLVVDLSVPHPEDLARDPERAYAVPRFRHPTAGLVKYRERFDYETARQILHVAMEFTPANGAPPWTTPLTHRQFFPQEIEALLHYNGFDIERVLGGFDGEPLDRESDSMIIFATRRR